jgi:hypothetical protein
MYVYIYIYIYIYILVLLHCVRLQLSVTKLLYTVSSIIGVCYTMQVDFPKYVAHVDLPYYMAHLKSRLLDRYVSSSSLFACIWVLLLYTYVIVHL